MSTQLIATLAIFAIAFVFAAFIVWADEAFAHKPRASLVRNVTPAYSAMLNAKYNARDVLATRKLFAPLTTPAPRHAVRQDHDAETVHAFNQYISHWDHS